MEPKIFENDTGEGLVCFDPSQWGSPEYREDNSLFYSHLLVGDKRVFEYGCPCGTCGIIFRRVGKVVDRVTDEEAVHLVGNLDSVPSDDVLRRLARILVPGRYYPSIIEGMVRFVDPGSPDDYFATDVVKLFGYDPPDANEPPGPWTSYYRLGADRPLRMTGYSQGTYYSYDALLTAVVMPLYELNQLDRDRIEYWKRRHTAGIPLTAFAVSVLDGQSPVTLKGDPDYPYGEQFLLTICTLDGHHRIHAAAELGVPVRILSLLTKEYSQVVDTDVINRVLLRYSRSVY